MLDIGQHSNTIDTQGKGLGCGWLAVCFFLTAQMVAESDSFYVGKFAAAGRAIDVDLSV